MKAFTHTAPMSSSSSPSNLAAPSDERDQQDALAPLPEAEIKRALRRAALRRDSVEAIVSYAWLTFSPGSRPASFEAFRVERRDYVHALVGSTGHDPNDPEVAARIGRGIRRLEELSYADIEVAVNGGGSREELEMAHAWSTLVDAHGRTPAIHPSKLPLDCGARVHLGRAPRLRSNHHSRRASGTRSGQDPGDGELPPKRVARDGGRAAP